jgi:hypothetical protein
MEVEHLANGGHPRRASLDHEKAARAPLQRHHTLDSRPSPEGAQECILDRGVVQLTDSRVRQ